MELAGEIESAGKVLINTGQKKGSVVITVAQSSKT
jgi:hypothetical protein